MINRRHGLRRGFDWLDAVIAIVLFVIMFSSTAALRQSQHNHNVMCAALRAGITTVNGHNPPESDLTHIYRREC